MFLATLISSVSRSCFWAWRFYTLSLEVALNKCTITITITLYAYMDRFFLTLLGVSLCCWFDTEKLNKDVGRMIGRQALTGGRGRVDGCHVSQDTLDEQDRAAEKDLLQLDLFPRRIHVRHLQRFWHRQDLLPLTIQAKNTNQCTSKMSGGGVM